jgi:hypothetical protein
LKIKNSCQDLVCIQGDSIQGNLGVQKCHKPLLWQTIALQNKIPSPQTWVMAHKVLEVLTPMVTQCVLNQFRGYWSLSDVIFAAITMCVMIYNTNSNTNEIV